MTRVLLGLSAAFLVVIAAAQLAYRASTDRGNDRSNAAWAQNKMEFVAWNNDEWTAWVHDDAFEQTPQNTEQWSRHSNASIAYVDWGGDPWQAKIEGDMFLLAYHGNWVESIDRTDAIQYRDWSGKNQIRTVADLKR